MEQQLTRPAPIPAVKLILGIFFTALGLLLVLDNFDVIDARLYLRYWPIVLIAIGLPRINDAQTRSLAIVLMVAGSLLLVWTTRWFRFSIFDLWPLLLVGGGVVIVAQAMGYSPPRVGGWSAILSQRKIAIDSREFAGGSAAVFMGNVDLDLTAADIAKSPAVIEVFVLMGGVELRVPDGWDVIAEAVPFMGGIDIKTQSKRTGRQLILRGLVMMGGIEVTDVAARLA